ncbi:MAG: hypothetical protein U0531_17900 [Dehalococcoidia bacterium]
MDLTFADFGIAPPSAPAVVSVEDRGVMEVMLIFVKTGGFEGYRPAEE